MRIQEFDFSVNLLQVLLWEYNDASKIQGLLEAKQLWYTNNQTNFWNDWYTNVFNLQTANTFGCAVWSIILNIPCYLRLAPIPPGKKTWGFGTYRENFNNGNFTGVPGGDIILPLDEQRLILKLRYFNLITRGAIPEINAFLKFAFVDYGSVYVLDNLDMTISYVFTFSPPDKLLAALQSTNTLPRPASIKIAEIITP